ncbi:phosphotransferase family protein [Alicyclobacillus fodiniaquatilis]|uniref:Phosphotransferase family protein n=1 Tax=Alicyclobacillus fodiniaquatilis TaxID=1661150 RepID=A0ABW4JDK2_9BACL
MHARTIGREPEYRAIRAELASVHSANKPRDIADDVRRMFAETANQVDIQVDEAFYAALSSIERKMRAPGPFYAFSHGDPCPDNWLCDGETTKLIDYEFAGYKHALLDGVYGHIMFPTCWCVGLIPEALVAEMEDIYRKELMQGCAEAADDATFQEELFAACAYWTWHTLRGLLKSALEERHTWGIASTRARIVSRLAALLAMAERNKSSQYPLLVAVSQRLYALVSALWSEEKLQLYPCFQEK